MDPSKATFIKHPVHGDVRLFDEVIRDDERRWIRIRRVDTNALLWIPKDEVFGAEIWQL